MAVLTATQLQQCRQGAQNGSVPWTKPQANAAFQAIEDTMRGATVQTALSAAIDTAVSPLSLTVGQKRRLFREWARVTFEVGG